MFTAYVVVTLLAIAANAFSGVAAIVHYKPIIPGMARVGVPESWLTFPIGTLKTAGAAGWCWTWRSGITKDADGRTPRRAG